MTMRKTGKIWLGVGAATFLGGGVASTLDAAEPDAKQALPAQQQGATPSSGGTHAGHAPAGAPAKVTQGGEGGEGTGLDPRVKFFRDMGLVRGHLLVGDELVKAGLWDEALPHFHHPVEELYAQIGPKIKGQGLRQFDAALKALAQTVQAKNGTAYGNALKVVNQRMDETDKGMQKFAYPFVQSRVSTVLAILRTAVGEYGEAIEGGRITKPVEYQDSRGFVFYAELLLSSIAGELEAKDKATLAEMRLAFVELKKTWPTPVPPANPVKEPGAVNDDVNRFEAAALPFLKN